METITGIHLHRAIALAAGLALALVGSPSSSQDQSASMTDRIIFVNGELLDEEGLALVDQLNCGERVPSGNYWLDFENRVWGYVGGEDQYPLPDCSGDTEEAPAEESDCERQYRFSEDRMCYCYGVC
jgi:hypothetical protein